jgi:hypothetical protein
MANEIKFTSNIDLDGNEIQHAVIHPVPDKAALPPPIEGKIAYVLDDHKLYYYNGTAWITMGTVQDIQGTSPIVITSPSGVYTINITPATITEAGSLSAVDKIKLDNLISITDDTDIPHKVIPGTPVIIGGNVNEALISADTWMRANTSIKVLTPASKRILTSGIGTTDDITAEVGLKWIGNTLDIAGTYKTKTILARTNLTLSEDDSIVMIDATTSGVTVTLLPPGITYAGKRLTIKLITTKGAGVVVIGEMFDIGDLPRIDFQDKGQSIEFVCAPFTTGYKWMVVNYFDGKTSVTH